MKPLVTSLVHCGLQLCIVTICTTCYHYSSIGDRDRRPTTFWGDTVEQLFSPSLLPLSRSLYDDTVTQGLSLSLSLSLPLSQRMGSSRLPPSLCRRRGRNRKVATRPIGLGPLQNAALGNWISDQFLQLVSMWNSQIQKLNTAFVEANRWAL